jgi:hypothetical protein
MQISPGHFQYWQRFQIRKLCTSDIRNVSDFWKWPGLRCDPTTAYLKVTPLWDLHYPEVHVHTSVSQPSETIASTKYRALIAQRSSLNCTGPIEIHTFSKWNCMKCPQYDHWITQKKLIVHITSICWPTVMHGWHPLLALWLFKLRPIIMRSNDTCNDWN